MINRIQNKKVLYIFIMYINTFTYSVYFENNFYTFIYSIFYIIYKRKIFLKYIHASVCIYIYTVYTHVLYKQKLLFWMQLII